MKYGQVYYEKKSDMYYLIISNDIFNCIFNKCFALLILDEEKFINKKYDKNNPLIYELISNKKKRYVISYELHTIQYEDENYIYECDVSNHKMDKLSVLTRSIFG